jgi:hypothetical protein
LKVIKSISTLSVMDLKFVNRQAELRELDAAAAHGGLLVVVSRLLAPPEPLADLSGDDQGGPRP